MLFLLYHVNLVFIWIDCAEIDMEINMPEPESSSLRSFDGESDGTDDFFGVDVGLGTQVDADYG